MSEKSSVSLGKIIVISSSVIISTVLVFVAIFFLINNSSDDKSPIAQAKEENGKQVVELKAKFGFSPKISSIQANKDAVLRIDTSDTFDCSSTISVPKLGINQSLPSTGTKDFDIKPQTAGTVIDGTCSMGMYSFKIVVQ